MGRKLAQADDYHKIYPDVADTQHVWHKEHGAAAAQRQRAGAAEAGAWIAWTVPFSDREWSKVRDPSEPGRMLALSLSLSAESWSTQGEK